MIEERNYRIIWIDLLRIFSIFSMMVLHVAASYWSSVATVSFEWNVFNIYNSLVRFCVPVFVMISGVFFLDPERSTSIKNLFSKNIVRIIRAYIFWSFCYASSYAVFDVIKGEQFSMEFLKRIVLGHFHLWFLFTLVGLYLITPLLRKITEDKKIMEYFIFLFFIFELCYNFLAKVPFLLNVLEPIMEKTNIFLPLGYAGYYVWGLYLYKYDFSKQFQNYFYTLGVASVLFTILITAFLSIKSGTAVSSYYDYLLPNTFFVASALFLFFKYNISQIVLSSKTLKMVFLTSKISFCMYLFHGFVNIAFNLIGLKTTSYFSLISVPVNAIAVFGISFIVSFIISKIPILNKYIM